MKKNDFSYQIFGYDPGGKGANGVACMQLNEGAVTHLEYNTKDSIEESFHWIKERVTSKHEVFLGVDSFLYWSVKPGGMRRIDSLLREKYPAMIKSIMSQNSAFGAMPIGGMALAILASREYGERLHLNEVHPKLLYAYLLNHVRPQEKYDIKKDISKMKSVLVRLSGNRDLVIGDFNEHEFDAILCCLSTWKGLIQKEYVNTVPQEDVRECLFHTELPEVSFYWPERVH